MSIAPIDIRQRKEQFSKALIHAVATAAGFKLGNFEVDDESVDTTVAASGGGGTLKSPRLDVQLKCTESDVLKEDGIHFPLKRKNYDDLRDTELMVPKILVVMIVPPNPDDWLVCNSGSHYALSRYAWWVSIRGADEKAGVEKPTIVLPRSNEFTAVALQQLMTKVSNKETL